VTAPDPYAFLSPAAMAADGVHVPLLRSPIEHAHRRDGASFEQRDGWQLAVYEPGEGTTWIEDRSHLGKLDVRGTPVELDDLTGGLEHGHARRDGDIWTLRLTPAHGYVLCPFGRVAELRDRIATAIDVTSGMAAVAIGGDGWREVWARSSGLDVRPGRFGPHRCMAGSVLRVQTLVLHTGDDVLMLVGWEFGEYFWDAIRDAGAELGVVPVSPGRSVERTAEREQVEA
jgi:hypothetical protein